MSIYTTLLQFAIDEGQQVAMRKAQELQMALTTFAEIGSSDERKHAGLLVLPVEHAIRDIVNNYPQLETILAAEKQIESIDGVA